MSFLPQLLVRRQHFLPVRRAPSAIHPVPVGVEQPFVGFVPVEQVRFHLSRLFSRPARAPLADSPFNDSVMQLCAALSQPNECARSPCTLSRAS